MHFTIIHELAYDLEDFVHKVVTFPDVVVVCGMKQMLSEIERILQ